MICVHVPHSAGVSAAALKAIGGLERVASVHLARGRVTDAIELTLDGDVDVEDEGRIRAAVAEHIARRDGDTVAELRRRVSDLEEQVERLKGRG